MVELLAIGPVLQVLGLTLLSFIISGTAAVLYRWYVRNRIPAGVALLAGVSAVALYLNTQGALGQVVAGQTSYLTWEAVVFNTLSFLFAGLVTPAGQRGGDRIALSVMAMMGSKAIEGEMSQFVSTVGGLVAVEIPEQIDDIPGYDPVNQSVKDALADKTLLFPRRMTVERLDSRLRDRIKEDFDVGYVDLELTQDGTVEYLALGQRVAGIGPTLGAGTGVVAIEADPPNAASAGDVVEIWEIGSEKRSAKAELRGVAGDVVTIALDEHDARDLAGNEYRLVTLPSGPNTEREFAGLLRAAEETMAAISVEDGSELAAQAVGELGVTVVAVKPDRGTVEPLPPRSRSLDAGDTVYVVAHPTAIRRLEDAAAT